MRIFFAALLCLALCVALSCCKGDDDQSSSQKDQIRMYYSVEGNKVVVHNTPWGDKNYIMNLPTGAVGGAGKIYVGENNEPRIEIIFRRDIGVVAVMVDDLKIPLK